MKIHTFPLPIASYTHQSGISIHFPLTLPDVSRLQTAPERVASYLKGRIEHDLAQKGRYQELLGYFLDGELQQGTLTVELAQTAKEMGAAVTLNFDYFWVAVAQGGYVGFVPVLGLQAAGETSEALRETLEESIRLECIRKKRLDSLATLLSTQWFQEASAQKLEIDLPFYTLNELEEIERVKNESLLKQVAQQMAPMQEPVFGLDKTYEQLTNALRAKQRNSVIIAGQSGQGKTVLLRQFVRERREVGLGNVTVWEATAAQLLHRLTDKGGWEGQMGKLCKELRDTGDLLYVPDFSELFEVGQYAGNSRSIADYVRPYIARGEITLLTECTPESATQIELRAPGYLALFARIDLPKLTTGELQDIVQQKVQDVARLRKCDLSETAIRETLRLQQWFTPYSGLPGKTIQFLDALMSEAGKREQVRLEKTDIYARFSQETGMPAFILNPDAPLDLVETEAFFTRNIYGQDEAVRTLLDVLVSIKAAVIRRGKPLASLLFAGPTGVGKTEMAKVLAQFLFGERERMIRFDMSEYRDLPALMRLTGDDGRGEGLLTAAVRQHPFSVILFDELEKVNPLFYDMLLQILGEGRLTSSTGRVADFCSTLIIMTSNIGAGDFQTGNVGFVNHNDQAADATAHFRKAVQTHFRPELFNRLDRIIAFAPLGRKVLRQIVTRELALIRRREGIRGRHLRLVLSEEVADYLGEKGYHPLYGARFLQRFLQRELIMPLAQCLNRHSAKQALQAKVEVRDGQLSVETIRVDTLPRAKQAMSGSDLSLEDFSERTSDARRSIAQLVEARLYVELSNRLDSLTLELEKLRKQKREEHFWQDSLTSQWYTRALELEESRENLTQRIQAIELDGLMLMNELHADEAQLLARFQAWEAQQQTFVQDVIRLMHPTWDRCVVTIFGHAKHLIDLLRPYMHIAQKKGWQTKLVYVRHSKQDEAARKEAIRLAEEQEDTDALEKAERETPYRFEELDWEKPAFRHTPCGIILDVKGDLVYPFFLGEEGAHLWREGEQKDTYVVHVHAMSLATYRCPDKVHRKEYFRDLRPRRIYQGDSLIVEKKYLIRASQTAPRWIPIWMSDSYKRRIKRTLFG